MTIPNAKKSNNQIELIPASPSQQSILANLLELYVYDFSDFLPVQLGEDGRFGYKHLSAYWREPNRYPFLVRVDGNLAGFVFVKKGSVISNDDSTWDMAEFFIVRHHRRNGFGTAVAHQVFKRFPGDWEVRVMDINESACRFWNRAIQQFTGQPICAARLQQGEQGWHVFAFQSQPA